jgi:multicomponent Na+:H+ antiporter subunit F
MTFDVTDPLPFVVRIATAMLVASFLVCLWRLARGPSLADRVVALDLTTSVAVAYCGVRALAEGDVHTLRPALVAALLAFLGTVAFARFLERKAVDG